MKHNNVEYEKQKNRAYVINADIDERQKTVNAFQDYLLSLRTKNNMKSVKKILEYQK